MDTKTLLDALPALRARARRIAKSHSEAEDLLQAVLLGVLEQGARGQIIQTPVRYAMISLRRAGQSNARLRRRETTLEEAPEPQTGDASEACLCSEVLRAIDTLAPADRMLLRLVADGETSPAALALVLGVPKGTVMSRLARARARLRLLLGEEDV